MGHEGYVRNILLIQTNSTEFPAGGTAVASSSPYGNFRNTPRFPSEKSLPQPRPPPLHSPKYPRSSLSLFSPFQHAHFLMLQGKAPSPSTWLWVFNSRMLGVGKRRHLGDQLLLFTGEESKVPERSSNLLKVTQQVYSRGS